MGVTLNSFHSWGIIPVKIVKFMRYAIGLAISGSASFRTLAGIPARPVAFDVFSLHGSCLTNFGLTSFKVKSRLTLGVSTIGVKVCEKCLHKLPAMVVKNSLKLVADRLLVSFVTFDFLGRVWLSVFHFSFESCSSEASGVILVYLFTDFRFTALRNRLYLLQLTSLFGLMALLS